MSKASTKHGMCKTRLYRIWCNMKTRTGNNKHKHYKYYGGKGIAVCSEWIEFKGFMEWALNNGYSEKMTLDRIDQDGDYEANNCRFITMKQQSRNKKNNRMVTYDGKTKCLADWAKELGLGQTTLRHRLLNGWDVEKAFSTPVGEIMGRRKLNGFF